MISENELLKLIKNSIKSKNKIDIKSNSNNTEGWDSLGQLSILTSLDKTLKGKTSKIASLANADSVQKLLKILKSKKLLK